MGGTRERVEDIDLPARVALIVEEGPEGRAGQRGRGVGDGLDQRAEVELGRHQPPGAAEGLQRLDLLSERRLQLPARGDVADDGEHRHPALAAREEAVAGLHEPLAAVGAPDRRLEYGRARRSSERRPIPRHGLVALALREDHGEAAADDLLGAVAVELVIGGVGQQDDPVGIGDRHRVPRRLPQRADRVAHRRVPDRIPCREERVVRRPVVVTHRQPRSTPRPPARTAHTRTPCRARV